MTGRSDADQAALCWRNEWVLMTFDWDFFDAHKLPSHRNPGVVICDCDRRRI